MEMSLMGLLNAGGPRYMQQYSALAPFDRAMVDASEKIMDGLAEFGEGLAELQALQRQDNKSFYAGRRRAEIERLAIRVEKLAIAARDLVRG